MKILVAGASGLVGKALCPELEKAGHVVYILTREMKANQEHTLVWNPGKSLLDVKSLEGFDAVVNLAGENISSGRWTTAKKKAILESRTSTTSLLCSALSKLNAPPKVVVNASAVGYYGNRGDELLDESSSSGMGFLAQVCRSWEAAASVVKVPGVRLVLLRIGVVLTPTGGALKKMLLPFKLCLGGRIGSGKQYISWIAIEDLVRIILFCLKESSLSGPVNAVAPNAVTNALFTQELGKALGRPTIFPLPETIVRLVLGEMGEELLLNSVRVKPKKLEDCGFEYLCPELKFIMKF